MPNSIHAYAISSKNTTLPQYLLISLTVIILQKHKLHFHQQLGCRGRHGHRSFLRDGGQTTANSKGWLKNAVSKI